MKSGENSAKIISGRKLIALAILALVSSLSIFLADDYARLYNYAFRATIPVLVLFTGWLVYSASRGELRNFVIVINLSVLLNIIGETINTLNLEASKGGIYPSIADLFWILAYIPVFALVSLQIVKMVSNLNIKSVILAGIFLVSGTVAISILFNSLSSSQMDLLSLLSLSAYPILDIIIISALIILLASYYRLQINYYWSILILSFSFMAIGDTVGAYYKMLDLYRVGSISDVFINLYYSSILVGLYIIYKHEIPFRTAEGIEKERAELENLNRELKKLSEYTSIANKIMRHDIINDISVIKSYLDLYRLDRDIRYLKRIEDKIHHIVDVINDSREFEKLLSVGKLKEMDLKAEVEKAVSHFRDEAEFSINLDGEKVVADDLLSSVVYNLIHNSVRHNDKKIKLSIDANKDGEWVLLRISDNGKGIPEEFREKIFEEGFKYGESGNTGLGLYLVKQTIDRYGGSIKIGENTPSGAVFLIKLRRA